MIHMVVTWVHNKLVINFRWAHLSKRNLKTELGGRVKKSVSFPALREVLMEFQTEITFS